MLDLLEPSGMVPAAKKNVLSANQKSMVIHDYVWHCDSWYAGCTTQRFQECSKQHVPKPIRVKNHSNSGAGELTNTNQQKSSQIENAKQKVRLHLNQRVIQP